MSRILARSVSADILARVFSAVLFLLLLPFIVILSRRLKAVPVRTAPFSVRRLGDRVTEPS
jgi:hypothetical protein